MNLGNCDRAKRSKIDRNGLVPTFSDIFWAWKTLSVVSERSRKPFRRYERVKLAKLRYDTLLYYARFACLKSSYLRNDYSDRSETVSSVCSDESLYKNVISTHFHLCKAYNLNFRDRHLNSRGSEDWGEYEFQKTLEIKHAHFCMASKTS